MALTVDHPLCIPLLIGLWTEADDDGVFEWKPLTIKAKVLPAAPVDMGALLEVLVSLDFIMKFDANGKAYGAIRNFKTWQRPKQPKVKYPKTPTATTYVGVSGGGVPHDLPTDGEKSPQREEEGGRKKEEQESPPSPPGGGAAFSKELAQTYPASNHSNFAKAERMALKLPPELWSLVLSKARTERAKCEADRQKRGRDAKAHAEFVKGLDTWLREEAWKSQAPELVPPVPMTKLDRERDAELWAACERVMGRPAPTADMTWSFSNTIIEQARAKVAA